MTNADIQPIALTCQPPILFKGNPWWQGPKEKPRFVMDVCDLVPIARFQDIGARPIAARRIVSHFDNFFADKLGYGHSGTRS